MQEQRPPFTPDSELSVVLSGISPSFDGLSQSPGQVIHVLLTRAPVYSPSCPDFLPRLACLRHAASVRSEPGSNSPCKLIVSSRVDAATASNGMDRPQLNQRNRTGLDPHSIPAARLKACTTIQFSKTSPILRRNSMLPLARDHVKLQSRFAIDITFRRIRVVASGGRNLMRRELDVPRRR